jgi:gamma-glutamylcyclotransferase (GGCT)/AIG2-like uncharacterized protein YtfP
MNTNREEMADRCLDSEDLGEAVLPDHRFEFKHHATVTPKKKSQVHGVLWRISDMDEIMLDLLEGYPSYYDKKTVVVKHRGQDIEAMTYNMKVHVELNLPSDSYYHMVAEGYRQHGIDQHQLKYAKERAMDSEIKKYRIRGLRDWYSNWEKSNGIG